MELGECHCKNNTITGWIPCYINYISLRWVAKAENKSMVCIGKTKVV